MERSQRKRQDRVNRVDTAMRLIAQHGISGFNLHKLAAELDLTVGALYRYFPSKMALLAEARYRVIHAIDQELRSAVQRVNQVQQAQHSDAIAIRQIIHLSEAYRTSLKNNPEWMILISYILSSPGNVLEPELAHGVMHALQQALSAASHALEDATQKGFLNPADQSQRSIILWTTMQGLIQIEKLQRHDAESFKPVSLYNIAINTLLMGWGCSADVLLKARRDLDTLWRHTMIEGIIVGAGLFTWTFIEYAMHHWNGHKMKEKPISLESIYCITGNAIILHRYHKNWPSQRSLVLGFGS